MGETTGGTGTEIETGNGIALTGMLVREIDVMTRTGLANGTRRTKKGQDGGRGICCEAELPKVVREVQQTSTSEAEGFAAFAKLLHPVLPLLIVFLFVPAVCVL